MEFRPCIDVHNGQVKQIVGGSLLDEGDRARENFVAGQDAAYFAGIYRDAGIRGGHVILLNSEERSDKKTGIGGTESISGRAAGRRWNLPGECGGFSGSGCVACDRYIVCIL